MKLAPIRSTALTFATLLLAASAAPPKAEPTTARAADAEFLKESKQAKSTDATEQAAYEAWFGKYRLDLNDPKMLDADADGDGASNRDEFLADTNPRNASSHPPTGAAQRPRCVSRNTTKETAAGARVGARRESGDQER